MKTSVKPVPLSDTGGVSAPPPKFSLFYNHYILVQFNLLKLNYSNEAPTDYRQYTIT